MVVSDTTEMEAGLRVLFQAGAAYELRIPKVRRKVVSGYFDDPDRLIKAVLRWGSEAPGVYMTLNPVARGAFARAANKVLPDIEQLTADKEIERRTFIPLDFDPKRVSGVSSNDEEHEAALERAARCCRWLIDQGVPRHALVLADSGNGAHVLIRVDLPNSDSATTLVKRILQTVNVRWGDEAVDVDMGNFNAARIWKVYGTVARKGDDIPERPHRLARIVQAPETLEICSPGVLSALAAQAPPEPDPRVRTTSDTFDIEGFIDRYLASSVARCKPWNGGVMWLLNPCPMDDSHRNVSACIIRHPSGAVSFTCHHNGCQHRTWRDVREKFEPVPGDRSRTPLPAPKGVRRDAPSSLAGREKDPKKVRLAYVNSMAEVVREDIRWLWYPYIPLGKITSVEGDPEARKTWLLLAIGTAVSRGAMLPGETIGRDPGRVLLLAGEDGLADTIKPRLEWMGADQTLIRPVTGLINEDTEEPLTMTAAGIEALREQVAEYRPVAVFIDPLVAYMGGEVDINKANEVRAMLRPLGNMAQEFGCAMVVTRHFNKAVSMPLNYRGQGSVDFLAIARASLYVSIDRSNPLRSIMAPYKASLTEKGQGVAYIVSRVGNAAEFLWDGLVDITADELAAIPVNPEDRSQLDEAKAFLVDALMDGPRPVGEIHNLAKKNGVSDRTLERAKSALKIKSIKDRAQAGVWLWRLPFMDSSGHVPISEQDKEKDAKDAKNLAVGEHGGLQTSVRLPYSDEDEEPF